MLAFGTYLGQDHMPSARPSGKIPQFQNQYNLHNYLASPSDIILNDCLQSFLFRLFLDRYLYLNFLLFINSFLSEFIFHLNNFISTKIKRRSIHRIIEDNDKDELGLDKIEMKFLSLDDRELKVFEIYAND